MRIPVLLLASLLALAASGCLGKDDGPEPPAGSTPPATTPDATPPPSTPDPTPDPTPTPTTPAPPARKVVYNGTHDFSGPPPAPGSPPRTENFTVDEGHGTLEVRVDFASTAGPTGDISLSAGVRVRVLDPDGTAVVDCDGKSACSTDVPDPKAGLWKVEYAGSGTQKATVTITAD